MCPWGVLGPSLGVLVGSPGLPGGSSGRPRSSSGILGDTLGVLGCSWGLLGRLLGGSLGGLGESLSGPSAPYATHTDVSAFSVFRCSCVVFSIISCSREAQGNSAQFMETSGGQSSPDAMHSDVLAHSGASSLAAMWVQGSPWVSLGRPLGVLGGSFWIRCGRPMRQTLRTPTFQRLVFFYVFPCLFFQSFRGDSLGDPLGGLGPHMLCTPMFRAYSRARFGSTRLETQRASAGLSGTLDQVRAQSYLKGNTRY